MTTTTRSFNLFFFLAVIAISALSTNALIPGIPAKPMRHFTCGAPPRVMRYNAMETECAVTRFPGRAATSSTFRGKKTDALVSRIKTMELFTACAGKIPGIAEGNVRRIDLNIGSTFIAEPSSAIVVQGPLVDEKFRKAMAKCCKGAAKQKDYEDDVDSDVLCLLPPKAVIVDKELDRFTNNAQRMSVETGEMVASNFVYPSRTDGNPT